MDKGEFKQYRVVQDIARTTISYLTTVIGEGVSESEIAEAANSFMKDEGATSFWYHDIGSLVLVGDRTTLSVSGKDYKPTDKKVESEDLVTVDLGPQIGPYWGDFARSFVIKDGIVIYASAGASEKIMELNAGLDAVGRLHTQLQHIAALVMTFDKLYSEMNDFIDDMGYCNLDFRGNLGHTIEKDMNSRRYIESGSSVTLGEAGLFTFEPHIKTQDGLFGFKREDIYCFLDGKLEIL